MSSKPHERTISGKLDIKITVQDVTGTGEAELIAKGLIDELIGVMREAATREGFTITVSYSQTTY
jgi:hypothetical protein